MRWRRRAERRAERLAGDAPTLIIPQGTRIEVDAHGQLSISAPGNLVIQNSGQYGTLESQSGSIRIDRAVEVEAVTVRCAETCYVQGSLTAWKVVARALHLEESARVHVVLQETTSLEVGRDARLVGGFATEGDIYGLFSRFAREVRALPFLGDRKTPAELADSPAAESAPPAGAATGEKSAEESSSGSRGATDAIHPEHAGSSGRTVRPPGARRIEPADEPGDATLAGVAAIAAALTDLPEPLLFALVLLEREAERRIHPRIAQRALEQIVKLLQEQDLETLRHTWRTLFGRIAEPREDAARARELVAEFYAGAGERG